MMLVYQINGRFWRENGDGTGGNAGHLGLTYDGCGGRLDSTGSNLPQELPRIAGSGIILHYLCWPPAQNPHGIEAFRMVGDSLERDFRVDIGAGSRYDSYDTATVCFVGGLLTSADWWADSWIVMYEFNGEFIREPGDTANLVRNGSNAVEPIRTDQPVSYLTANNYPNPFNATTTILYSVPVNGDVSVTVFDLAGREVATLAKGFQTAGRYAIAWNGSDFASGIYFYRVNLGEQYFVNRMVLLK
jgi:hypothetical protein